MKLSPRTVDKLVGVGMVIVGSLLLLAEWKAIYIVHETSQWLTSLVSGPDSLALLLTGAVICVLWVVVICITIVGAFGVVFGSLAALGIIDIK